MPAVLDTVLLEAAHPQLGAFTHTHTLSPQLPATLLVHTQS